MFSELLTELSSTVANKELKKIKEADPEKYDQTLKMFLTATEVGIHFLKESPEFREGFARIHSEFLRHPECQSTIQQAIKSAEKYMDKNEQ